MNLAERTYDDEGESANARDRAYVAMRKAELAEVQARIARENAELAQVQKRSELAEQQRLAATAEELAETRAQLESQRGQLTQQEARLQEESERRAQAEREQARALKALENVTVRQEQRGTVIMLPGNVLFETGSSELLPAARTRLTSVAEALSRDGADSSIVIEGHTDATGSDERNRALSLARAASVRDWLVERGVPAHRIVIDGFGASRPIADNSSPTGRASNRRVEIVVQPGESGAERQPVRGRDVGTGSGNERQPASGRDVGDAGPQ